MHNDFWESFSLSIPHTKGHRLKSAQYSLPSSSSPSSAAPSGLTRFSNQLSPPSSPPSLSLSTLTLYEVRILKSFLPDVHGTWWLFFPPDYYPIIEYTILRTLTVPLPDGVTLDPSTRLPIINGHPCTLTDRFTHLTLDTPTESIVLTPI